MVSISERMMSVIVLIIKMIVRINVEMLDYVVMLFFGVFCFGSNSYNFVSMISVQRFFQLIIVSNRMYNSLLIIVSS